MTRSIPHLRSPHPTTIRRLLVAIVLVAVGLLAAGPPAGAHAELVATTPGDGEVVADAPATVRLEFSEDVRVSLGAIRVFDRSGTRVDSGNEQSSGTRTAEVRLGDDLGDGTYVVTWRVVSADAHPIHGAFLFSVGQESAVDDGLVARLFDQDGDRAWQVAGAVLRGLAYLGVFLAAGAAVLVLVIGRPGEARRLRGTVVAGSAVGAAAVLLLLPVQAALATGLGLGAIAESGVLGDVVSDGLGWSTLLGLAGLALLVGTAGRDPDPGVRRLVLAGAALATTSFALAGHTRVSEPAWLTTAADAAHAVAGATWFGGLVALLVLVRHRRTHDDAAGAADAVAGFSGLATWALAVVAVAGVLLGWAEVRSLDALTSTTYGRLLMVKVGVVALVGLAGLYNRTRLVPLVVAQPDPPARWHRLTTIVRAEAVGLVVVLALTGVLVNVTPARTAAGVGGVVSVSAELGDGSVNLTVDPPTAGPTTIHIYLLDELGRQVDRAQTVELEFSLPAQDLGPITRRAVKAGPGHFQYDGDAMSLPGRWTITTVARISRFDEARASVQVTMR